jgi:hypothetical protein
MIVQPLGVRSERMYSGSAPVRDPKYFGEREKSA